MSSSTAEDPLVSVIIPAYNAAAFLPRAVESVLDQTYSNVEVIVIDDGSTDETPQVMEPYDDPVRYLQKENGGAASARNVGIREARGTYIGLLDADDEWVPEKLEQQVVLHQSNPELMWSYTNWLQVDQSTGKTICRADQVMDNQDGDVLRPLIGRLFIPPSTELFHKDVFEKVGMHDEAEIYHIGVAEDWEFSLRVAAQYSVGYIDRPLVRRYQHASKSTSTMDLDLALRGRRATIEKAFRNHPERLSELKSSVFANLYTNLGRKWLDRERRLQALKMFCTAIRHHPTYWRAWLFGAASFFPRVVLRSLGKLRSFFWSFTRSDSSRDSF
ncbi:MAG: glycosyl transferase family 2 [Bacteroidetes bacterium SW_9_63_38]|nr:MAG: glycosyl transferase family 2 [Bacteroidetes bacterium SW_9_63_38]